VRQDVATGSLPGVQLVKCITANGGEQILVHSSFSPYSPFCLAGLSTDIVYPNGISCTLPEDLQQKMVNTIAGLENAKMLCPGRYTANVVW